MNLFSIQSKKVIAVAKHENLLLLKNIVFCNACKLCKTDFFRKTKGTMLEYNSYSSVSNPHITPIYSQVEVISSKKNGNLQLLTLLKIMKK